ncbi:hypothetical protein GCM10009628_03340 [Paeniglutamicibacter kerguelensis]
MALAAIGGTYKGWSGKPRLGSPHKRRNTYLSEARQWNEARPGTHHGTAGTQGPRSLQQSASISITCQRSGGVYYASKELELNIPEVLQLSGEPRAACTFFVVLYIQANAIFTT